MAEATISVDEAYYQEQGVDEDVFLFGYERSELVYAFPTTGPVKKKLGK